MDGYDMIFLTLVVITLILNTLASMITHYLLQLGYVELNIFRPDPSWNPALSLVWSVSVIVLGFGLIYWLLEDHPKARAIIASMIAGVSAYDFMHDFLLLINANPYCQVMLPYMVGVLIPITTALALISSKEEAVEGFFVG